MRALSQDLSIYKELNLAKPPVGVKFSIPRPEGIKQLDKNLPFCEMINEAQRSNEPFYFSKDNEDCVGKVALGMVEMEIFDATHELWWEPVQTSYEVIADPQVEANGYLPPPMA